MMKAAHPQGNLIKRLFGNENAESHAATEDDNWEQQTLLNTGAGVASADTSTAPQPVTVVGLPKPADPTLKVSQLVNLANAAPAGGLQISCRGNCLLYADSTNGTDRLLVTYADTQGDNAQPQRSMVPGRLRRERYFNFLYVTWTVTAGATATLEIYDDPDGALYIQD
jgi:hypothetical protein